MQNVISKYLNTKNDSFLHRKKEMEVNYGSDEVIIKWKKLGEVTTDLILLQKKKWKERSKSS